MSSKPYAICPTFAQWKKDSSVKLAKRSKDSILKRIDEIVKAIERGQDAGVKSYLFCELFFCLDKWLEMHNVSKGRSGSSGRKKAVERLYKFVANQLCLWFATSINVLPKKLEEMFGREMSDHGSKLDHEWNCATYLTRAEANKYALRYQNGKAYQLPWWKEGAKLTDSKLVHAESSRAHVPGMFRDSASGQYGGFAMSMSRTIYMAKHFYAPGNIGKNANFYHSSYLGGETVMCAGSMLIRNGRVLRLKTDSGHFQPTKEHMLNVISALKMQGVSTAELICVSYDGSWSSTASDFVRANGNWSTLLARKAANLQFRNEQIDEKRTDKWLVEVWKKSPNGAAIAKVQYFLGGSRQQALQRIKDAYDRFITIPANNKNELNQRALKKLHTVSM